MPNPPPQPGSPLTPDEIRIIAGLARGQRNDQIAKALYMSRDTVRNHLTRISVRLGTSSRGAIVDRGYQLGYLRGLPAEDRRRTYVPPRQLEILQAMAEGLTTPQIAARHHISLDSAKTSSRHLFRRLRVHSRAHAVAIGYQHGHLTLTTTAAQLTTAA